MLVLTRKTGQSIMIGDDIEISVLAVSRDKIRIGITAPKEVPVFRKEVWISIKDGVEAEGAADAEDGDDGNDGDDTSSAGAARDRGSTQNNGIEDAIIEGAAAQVEEALGRKD
jgi:carbon storage regulator